MKKFSQLSGILLCSLLLFACSENKTPDDTLVTTLTTPPTNLNPLFSTGADSQHINQLVHISLIKIGEKLTPVPFLAKSFKVVDAKTIDFTLNQGCLFQNGREIVAEDVKNSFAIFTNPENKSPYRHAFSKVDSITVSGKYSVRIKTKKVEPDFLTDLTLLKILPLEDFDLKKFRQSPIGGGPYKVTKFEQSGIELTRFDNKCQKLAGMPKIQLKIVREDLSRFLKLQRGEIDIVMNDLHYNNVKKVLEKPDTNLKAITQPGITYSYMGVNFANEHLKKLKVRQALAHSLDIPTIIKYKLAGMATPAHSVLARSNWYSNQSLLPLEYNPEKANKLLDEAGYSNGSNSKPVLKLELKTTTNKAIMENAKVIAAQAKEVGIEITHKSHEWGTFYADIKKRNSELYLLRWVGVTEPALLYNIFHSGEIGANSKQNRTNYANKKMDRYLEESRTTLSPKKRREQFLKVQKLAHQELPYINLWFNHNAAVFRPNVLNVKLYPNGSWQTMLEVTKIAANKKK